MPTSSPPTPTLDQATTAPHPPSAQVPPVPTSSSPTPTPKPPPTAPHQPSAPDPPVPTSSPPTPTPKPPPLAPHQPSAQVPPVPTSSPPTPTPKPPPTAPHPPSAPDPPVPTSSPPTPTLDQATTAPHPPSAQVPPVPTSSSPTPTPEQAASPFTSQSTMANGRHVSEAHVRHVLSSFWVPFLQLASISCAVAPYQVVYPQELSKRWDEFIGSFSNRSCCTYQFNLVRLSAIAFGVSKVASIKTEHLKTQAGLYNPTLRDNAHLMSARLDQLKCLLSESTGSGAMTKVVDHVHSAIAGAKEGPAKCADTECVAVHFVHKDCVWVPLTLFGAGR